MDKAIVAGDGATLDTLIAPDFIWVREGGRRTDKADFVHGLAAPGLKIEPFTPSEGRWLKSGDIAVFSAVNELHGSESGEADRETGRQTTTAITRARRRQEWRVKSDTWWGSTSAPRR